MFGISNKTSLWCGFVFSLIFAILTSVQLSFNSYALSVKKTFNFSQTQVELVASMGTVGMGLGFLEPLCTWLLGYNITCLILAIGIPASSGMWFLAAHFNQFIMDWPILIYTIQFILSVITNIGYLAVSRVCVEHFHKKHTAMVVGLHLAFACLGKIYYSGLIELFFSEDLAGFFLCLSVVSTVVFSCCMIFLYPIATNKDKQMDAVENSTEDIQEEKLSQDANRMDMLKSPFFHALFWTSVIYYGCAFACVLNITSISQSLSMADPLHTVYVMSTVIVFVRVGFGIIFSKFDSQWCGFALIMISYSGFFLAMIVSIRDLDMFNIMYVTVLIGIAMAPGFTIPVSIILLRFGRSHYSAVASSFFALSGACQTFAQIIMGYFYDAEIRVQGSTGRICYGRDCFYWTFSFFLLVAIVASLVQTLNFVLSAHYTNLYHLCTNIKYYLSQTLLGKQTADKSRHMPVTSSTFPSPTDKPDQP